MLEQRPIRGVRRRSTTASRVFNLTETLAAQEKARELDDRFADWVWEDPQRGRRPRRASTTDTFNAVVLRSYDDVAACRCRDWR